MGKRASARSEMGASESQPTAEPNEAAQKTAGRGNDLNHQGTCIKLIIFIVIGGAYAVH